MIAMIARPHSDPSANVKSAALCTSEALSRPLRRLPPPSVSVGWTPWVKSKKSVARLVPAWISRPPAKARTNSSRSKSVSAAAAVPTSTGTIDAGNENGRVASHQARRVETRGAVIVVPAATSSVLEADAASEQGPQRRIGVPEALGLAGEQPVQDDFVEGAEPGAAGDTCIDWLYDALLDRRVEVHLDHGDELVVDLQDAFLELGTCAHRLDHEQARQRPVALEGAEHRGQRGVGPGQRVVLLGNRGLDALHEAARGEV